MRVLSFGSINIDHIYFVGDFPKPGETLTANNYHKVLGGKGLNQTIALFNAGQEVIHGGQVGTDGDEILQYFKANGIQEKIFKSVNDTTGHAIINVNESGENNIVLFPGANKALDISYIDSVFEGFTEKDALVIQNEINSLDYIIKKAHDLGMIIFFNPAPFDQSIHNLKLDMVDYLIVNEHEAMGITSTTTVESAIQYFLDSKPSYKVIVTLGEKGSVYIDDGEANYFGTYKVDPIDTTAAGDTFIGYLVSAILKKQTIEDSIIIASKAAAITVSKKGSSVSIPTLSEVEETELKYLER